MRAIEEGIITPTTKSRMTEIEAALAEINMKISAEESKVERKLKKSDVEKYMMDAIEKEIDMLIELLIDKIILYDDRIEIYYNTQRRRKSRRGSLKLALSGYFFACHKNKNNPKGLFCNLLGMF